MGIWKAIRGVGSPPPLADPRRDTARIDRDPFEAVDDISAWDGANDPLRLHYQRERTAWQLKQAEEERRERAKADAEYAETIADFEAKSSHQFDWPRNHHGARYHVNPETGKASICKAKISCPFGEGDHLWINEEQTSYLRDHMGLNPEERSQFLGKLFQDQKVFKASVVETLKVGGSTPLRQIINEVEEDQENPPLMVEVDQVIMLDELPAVRIQRKIGNTREMLWKDHAYWEIAYEGGDRILRTDNFTEETIREFSRIYARTHQAKFKDVLEENEAREEIEFQLKNVIRRAESIARQAPADNAHHSVVPTFFNEATPYDSPVINYVTEGFSKEYLTHPATGNSSAAVLPVGKTIVNEEFGEGKGAWELTKLEDGKWRLELTGSRGDLKVIESTDGKELEAAFANHSRKRVVAGDWRRRQGFRGIKVGVREYLWRNKSSKTSIDGKFIRELVETDARLSKKLASTHTQHTHEQMFKSTSNAQEDKTMNTIYDLYQ